jgi:glyoxylase-like metal-dependent hydrolase (beta-lactamase superfamily II)
MIHETLAVGMLGCNCSIFGDEASREAIVIDPGDDIPAIEAILQRHGLRVAAIVITHAHIDHIGGAARLKQSTGAPVYMHYADQPLYDHLDMQATWLSMPTPDRTSVDVAIGDGSAVKLGATDFQVLHTPGHTPGSVCLWIPAQQKLIAGDTLFRESIGRTDLPGGDGRQILRSIRDKIWALPDGATVVPGHGPMTTVGHEREHNPFLQGF